MAEPRKLIYRDIALADVVVRQILEQPVYDPSGKTHLYNRILGAVECAGRPIDDQPSEPARLDDG